MAENQWTYWGSNCRKNVRYWDKLRNMKIVTFHPVLTQRCNFSFRIWLLSFYFEEKLTTGADLGFSRGGGGRIFKKFRKFCRPFFTSTKLIFRALPKHCFAPIWPNFEKNRPKKGVFRHFLEIFDQKIAFFFGARSPFKTCIYWRLRRLKKVFRVHHQKWISQNSTKGWPFKSAGGRIPKI